VLPSNRDVANNRDTILAISGIREEEEEEEEEEEAICYQSLQIVLLADITPFKSINPIRRWMQQQPADYTLRLGSPSPFFASQRLSMSPLNTAAAAAIPSS
jgi:3'-phosphoadenosine 5'-phosphosulfate sulfotransferase (PAPS reductase)/FAD synthetase